MNGHVTNPHAKNVSNSSSNSVSFIITGTWQYKCCQ